MVRIFAATLLVACACACSRGAIGGATPGLGAPLTGHSAAWAPRIDQRGMDGLIASIHSGRGTMPSMGYCPDCTDDDFRALIEFMATEGQS